MYIHIHKERYQHTYVHAVYVFSDIYIYMYTYVHSNLLSVCRSNYLHLSACMHMAQCILPYPAGSLGPAGNPYLIASHIPPGLGLWSSWKLIVLLWECTLTPRWPQNGPKRPEAAPRWPQDGPRWPQDGPKMNPIPWADIRILG